MKKVTRFIYKLFYIIAIILTILFVVFVCVTYFRYKHLLQNPMIELVPYSSLFKTLCKIFLFPAVISVILGFATQRYVQK